MSALLPHDPALPQLAQSLDPQAMAQVFARALSGLQVRSCAVDRIKYRPGRNCSVSYVLRLHDPERGRDVEQRVAARFCTAGDSARRHLKSIARATQASAAGPALLHLPALDMLAHWWPNDAKLDAPALLHDDERMRVHCVDKVIAALTGGRGRWVGHRTSIVQHVPELRVCARVDLHLQAEPGASITSQTLYAKADTARCGAATHALMQALHDSPAQAGGRLRTAQPVLWQAAAGLHWQLAVPGRALLDVDPQVGPAMSARVGEQLAALHATPVQALRSGPSFQPRPVAALLGQVEPAWKPLLTRLVDRLEAGAGALQREPAVNLHGDLHPRNILVDGRQLAFIDLDSVCSGPALIELGAWVADAMYRAVLGGVAQHRAAPSTRAFLAAYADASGRAVDESLLAWSTAHHLLCQRAYRCVANLKPGRFEAVPALLALAESIARAGSVDAAMACETEPA